jgi:hypothetical protein
MSIQSLSSNNANIAAMRAGMGSTQSLQGVGALPVANILQSVGQLLTALTPMLQQALQNAPLSPNHAAAGPAGALQSMLAVMGSVNQVLAQVLLQVARQAMASPQMAPGGAVAGPMGPSRAVQVLTRHFDNIKGADGKVGRLELARAADNPSSSPELKAAANMVLSNPKALASLDLADAKVRQKFGEQADGRFSKGDLTALLQKTTFTPGDTQAIDTLIRNKSALLSGDKLLSRAELGQIATTGEMPNGKTAPAELRVAAQHIQRKQELFDRLDDSNLVKNHHGQGPRGDGKISLADLQTTLQAARPAVRV